MPRRHSSLFDVLITLPWWVGVGLAGLVYVVLAVILPTVRFDNPFLQVVPRVGPSLAILFVLIFLLGAVFSAISAWRKRKLLDAQTGLASIRAMSWRSFETLVGEAYRRQGYAVTENTSAGADGGIDLILKQGQKTVLVQCKQYRSSSVGVKIIREMYGILVAEKADQVKVITSGTFTRDAQQFAQGKPIELIDGPQLAQLIQQVQASDRVCAEMPADEERLANTGKTCIDCGSLMVLRTA